MDTFNFNSKCNNLLEWKIDKISLKEDYKVTKIEFYNYIDRDKVPKLIKYLNTKEFRYCKEKKRLNNLFNILLAHNKKYISRNKYNKLNWDYINKEYIWSQNLKNSINIIKEKELQNYNFYYFVDFCKVITHRWSNFLIKIYRNTSKQKDFSKIEITYWIKKNEYNLFFWDWANKMKGISEIINKLTRKINYRFDILNSNNDFSWKIDIQSKINEILSLYDFQKQEKIIKILS